MRHLRTSATLVGALARTRRRGRIHPRLSAAARLPAPVSIVVFNRSAYVMLRVGASERVEASVGELFLVFESRRGQIRASGLANNLISVEVGNSVPSLGKWDGLERLDAYSCCLWLRLLLRLLADVLRRIAHELRAPHHISTASHHAASASHHAAAAPERKSAPSAGPAPAPEAPAYRHTHRGLCLCERVPISSRIRARAGGEEPSEAHLSQ